MNPMTTRTQQTTPGRWAPFFFLAAIVAVLATILSSASASAATTAGTETPVRASAEPVTVLVGPPEHIAAGQRLGNESVRVVTAVATGVAAKTAPSLIGKSYGLGTAVESPGLTIQGFRGAKNSSHALNQIINRGVSPSMLRNTVADPKVVLRQGSGNYLHLSDEAAVVLRPDGQVVTAYGRADFRQHIFDILADAG